jgi:predicted metal-dependent hydrolase
MSRNEESYWVDEMYRRFERKARTKQIDLPARARALARKYNLHEPNSIRWADNQDDRWGSCTPVDGSIRISSKLAKEPLWVLDYVIIHELAHLHVAAHNARFWSLVNRYPKTERARGFLMARDLTGAASND